MKTPLAPSCDQFKPIIKNTQYLLAMTFIFIMERATIYEIMVQALGLVARLYLGCYQRLAVNFQKAIGVNDCRKILPWKKWFEAVI